MIRLRPVLIVLLSVLCLDGAWAQDSVISLQPADPSASSSVEPAGPQPCGGETISIARMQWPSAELLAEIHARLIAQNDHYGADMSRHRSQTCF